MSRSVLRPSRLYWLTPLLIALPVLSALCAAAALYWPKLRDLLGVAMKLVVMS